MKKFLVTGADFKNKGGQSMLYITVNELRQRFPGCEIYFPTNKNIDSNYKLTPVFYCFDSLKYMHGGKEKIYAVLKGLAKNCLKKKGSLYQIRMLESIFPELDAIIDISGFNLSSDWDKNINFKYLEYIRQAKKYNVPVYLMPQSFGPFDYKKNQKKMDRDIRELLTYCKVVYAREKEGYDYLVNKYGLNNVRLSADLVLQNRGIDLKNLLIQPLPINVPQLHTNGNVAVIPNMKSIEHGNRESVLEMYKSLIDTLKRCGKNIYVFHHSSNDSQICQCIKDLFPDDGNVILLNEEFDCIQYSKFIRQFDYIIASRYHSIVHALKEGVPCVALGWAIKYVELLERFGMKEFVFNITGSFDIEKICLAIEELDKYHEQFSKDIIKKIEEIQNENCFDSLGKEEDIPRVDKTTVRFNLCNSCGVCVGVCPKNCISLTRSRNGQYLPVIDDDNCIKCGLCSKICQGRKNDFLEMAKITDTKWNEDLLSGDFLSAYTGFAINPEIRQNGVSGGSVTALVKHLLDEKLYDSAFMVNKYSYRESVCSDRISSSDDMVKTPLSRYVTISHEETVKYIINHPKERVIIIAVPCAVQGILRVIHEKRLIRDNYLFIGLVCDKTMTNQVFDYFEKLVGEEIQELYFRTKKQSGWPGNVGVLTSSGIQYLPAKQRTRVKEYFQPERCLYCLDKINRYADIVFGDDYTGNCSEKGGNIIVVNTLRGQNALSDAPIELNSIEREMVYSSIKLDTRKENIEFIRCFERKTGLEMCPQVEYSKNDAARKKYSIRVERIIEGGKYADNPERFIQLLDNKESVFGKVKKHLKISDNKEFGWK